MKKFDKVTKEIDGIKYTAQFNGFREMYRALDQVQDSAGKLNLERAADYIFENVIVEPKMTIDDFEDVNSLNEVIAFGMEVMQGNKPSFPESKGKAKGKAAGN